jgi:hypothetical protein
MRLAFLPLTCPACMTSIALIEPAYLLRLLTTLLRPHPSPEIFGVADWRVVGSITRFRQHFVLAMTGYRLWHSQLLAQLSNQGPKTLLHLSH